MRETIRTTEREALESSVILEAYAPEMQQKVADMLVEVQAGFQVGKGPGAP